MKLIKMFVSGQAMSGGSISKGLQRATFLGEVKTVPIYRFYSVRDEFPGLSPFENADQGILGELYELTYEALRKQLLPLEPKELELSLIELEDASGSLSMIVRESALKKQGVTNITEFEGWFKYMNSKRLREP